MITLEDNPPTLEMLRSMTRVWKWLQKFPQPERGRFWSALSECSDDLQEVVLRMLNVVENPQSTTADRKRAMMTIADALFLNPAEEDGEYGMDLVASESGAALQSGQLAQDVAKMDAQEATFALRLRSLMESKGVSQQELAERISCTQPAISQMLNRNCRPQKKTILKLAEALNVNPRELWPDLEVAEMLDSVASFQQDDYVMTDAEAKALRDTGGQNRPTIPARSLPKGRR